MSVSPAELARPFDFDDDLCSFQVGLGHVRDATPTSASNLWKADRPDTLLSLRRGARLDVPSVRPPVPRRRPLRGAGRAAEEVWPGRRADVRLCRPSSRRVPRRHGPQDHPRRALGPWLRARQAARGPHQARDMRRVSEQFHRIEGMLYLYGYRVKPHTRLERPSILDIAPTVLAFNGLGRSGRHAGPGPERGAGHRRAGARCDYTGPAGPCRRRARRPAIRGRSARSSRSSRASATWPARAPADISDRATATSPESISRPAVTRRRAAAYARLVEEEPDRRGAAHELCAGALGALGRYDAAYEQLDESRRARASERRGVPQPGRHPRAAQRTRGRDPRVPDRRPVQPAVRAFPQGARER